MNCSKCKNDLCSICGGCSNLKCEMHSCHCGDKQRVSKWSKEIDNETDRRFGEDILYGNTRASGVKKTPDGPEGYFDPDYDDEYEYQSVD